MTKSLSIYAAQALQSLNTEELDFLKALPKSELHAHLNGSIPLSVLQDLAKSYTPPSKGASAEVVSSGIERLQRGVEINELNDFFGLFPAIYALTGPPEALRRATAAVLDEFLKDQVTYFELRSTPKENTYMSRLEYVECVLDEVEKYGPEQAALIVSVSREMSPEVAAECIDVAVELKQQGRRVVGVDLCGDPTAGDMDKLEEHFKRAHEAGLGVTLHIAEIKQFDGDEDFTRYNKDVRKLLSFKPDRLGHATFLNQVLNKEEQIAFIDSKTPVELCISSNLLCKTVETVETHHILHYLEHNHPIAICTDDVLPFKTNMLGEYAILLAEKPFGLGLKKEDVERIAKMSFESRFKVNST